MSNTLCFTCDLKNDPELIKEYKQFHQPGNTWKSIVESIQTSGVQEMEIYLVGTRMFMIMKVEENFDLEKKRQLDESNPEVVRWEKLMSTFQQPYAYEGNETKWLKMERIFRLTEHIE